MSNCEIAIDEMTNKKRNKSMEEILASLTDREKKVLRERFGTDPNEGDIDLEEVGKKYDITRKRIEEIEETALRKLRDDDDSDPDAA